MRFSTGVAAGLAALAVLATSMPAQANAGDDAEKVRRLDIMLMVSALRCRNTSDGFQSDYDRFSAAHLSELNAAAATLKQSPNARSTRSAPAWRTPTGRDTRGSIAPSSNRPRKAWHRIVRQALCSPLPIV